jgi:hypothetical protein
MHDPPDTLDGAQVLCFTPIDDRHVVTNDTRHFRDGALQTGFAGLIIANYPGESGYYLYYCDEAWQAENDTWHASLEDAKAQAEFEFRGTRDTWTTKGG